MPSFRSAALAALLALPACSSAPSTATTASDAGVDADPPACPTGDMPKSCPSPAPSWSGQVQGIFASRCGSCHGAGGVETNVADLGSYAGVYAARTTVLSQIYSCRMPPGGQTPPTAAERAALLGWLVCGAPNN